MARPLRVLVGAVVGAVLLGACGVPVDGDAQPTPDEEVPFDLLDATTTTAPSPDPAAGANDTSICLSLDGSLLVVGRTRRGDPPLDSLLALVTAGPTEGEADLGLRTAMGDDTVEEVDASGGLARVQLTEEFAELPGDQQQLALAQITCTLTGQPGISRVAFLLDGERTAVPVDDGSLVERPVTRRDYERFLAG